MAEKTLNELGGTLIAQLEEIVTGGDETAPAASNRFVSWCSPGIPFMPEDFTFCEKGLGGGATAEEEKLLLQQAYNFANLIDFIPDPTQVYDDDRRQAIWHTSQARLSEMYSEIIKFSKVVHHDLTDEQKAKIEKFRGLLRTTRKVKDLVTDEEKEVTVDGPMLQAYNDKMAAYTDAVLLYNSRRVAAAAATGVEGKAAVTDWANNAMIYRLKVKAAADAWVSGGYRNEVDQINAYINQVTQRDMMLWKQHLLEMYQEARVAGLGPGQEFAYSTLIPGNFAHSSGWTQFSVSHATTSVKSTSKSNSWNAGVKLNYGLFGGGIEASGSSSKFDQDRKLSSFKLSLELAQVVVSRPWFYPEFFMNRGWTLRKGEGWMHDDYPSDGGAPPKGLFLGYPTTILFARNIVIESADFVSAYHEAKKEAGGSGSVGWGPVRLEGGYRSGSEEKSFESTSDGQTLRVPGMQIIGFVNNLLGKSPNPLPELKDEDFA